MNASFTMSASDYMETAASVGYAYTSDRFKRGAKLYLFEIEMPEFNIIRRTGALSEKTSKKTYYFGEKMIEGSDPGRHRAAVVFENGSSDAYRFPDKVEHGYGYFASLEVKVRWIPLNFFTIKHSKLN